MAHQFEILTWNTSNIALEGETEVVKKLLLRGASRNWAVDGYAASGHFQTIVQLTQTMPIEQVQQLYKPLFKTLSYAVELYLLISYKESIALCDALYPRKNLFFKNEDSKNA
jgi:hypothetical protein